MDRSDNPYRVQRIETTRRNLDDAREAGDQAWIDAEEAILAGLAAMSQTGQGTCVGLHPHGPCEPGEDCNASPDPLPLQVQELREQLAERDDQLHSAHREIARLRALLKRRPADLSHGALITDRHELAILHARHPDAACWKLTHVGRPCGPSCLMYRRRSDAPTN